MRCRRRGWRGLPDLDVDDLPVRSSALEQTAFAEMYQRQFSAIFRYVRLRVASIEETEDLVSDVFLLALRSWPEFRGGSLRAWLFRIAHNRVANHYRSSAVRKGFGPGPAILDATAVLERAEQRATIWPLVQRLTSEQQEVIGLRFAGGLTTVEAARAMGKSEGAVKMLMFRAIQALRDLAVAEGLADER